MRRLFHLVLAAAIHVVLIAALLAPAVKSAEAQTRTTTVVQLGEALCHSLGCTACHAKELNVQAPDLHGLFNRNVTLSDGRTVRADEAYLRKSILEPREVVVAGFEPIMPSYRDVVTDEQVDDLLAYLKSLSPEPRQPNERPRRRRSGAD